MLVYWQIEGTDISKLIPVNSNQGRLIEAVAIHSDIHLGDKDPERLRKHIASLLDAEDFGKKIHTPVKIERILQEIVKIAEFE